MARLQLRRNKNKKQRHKNKKQAKRKPLRHPKRSSPLTLPTSPYTSPSTSPFTIASSPYTSPSTSPLTTATSPSTSPSTSPLTLPTSPCTPTLSVVPSSIRPSFSLQDSLIKSSLPDYLENLRSYSLDAAHTFCKRVAVILLVIFHDVYQRELQPRVDDVDKFLQNLLLRPFRPLSAFVNVRKRELGPSTMLSRFDDLSTFVSWYCLQEIAR